MDRARGVQPRPLKGLRNPKWRCLRRSSRPIGKAARSDFVSRAPLVDCIAGPLLGAFPGFELVLQLLPGHAGLTAHPSRVPTTGRAGALAGRVPVQVGKGLVPMALRPLLPASDTLSVSLSLVLWVCQGSALVDFDSVPVFRVQRRDQVFLVHGSYFGVTCQTRVLRWR